MNDRARAKKARRLLAGRADGGREGNIRQQRVTSAAEQTGGDSRAPSYTTLIRYSRTAHHMGWHDVFIQSLGLHAGLEGENGAGVFHWRGECACGGNAA